MRQMARASVLPLCIPHADISTGTFALCSEGSQSSSPAASAISSWLLAVLPARPARPPSRPCAPARPVRHVLPACHALLRCSLAHPRSSAATFALSWQLSAVLPARPTHPPSRPMRPGMLCAPRAPSVPHAPQVPSWDTHIPQPPLLPSLCCCWRRRNSCKPHARAARVLSQHAPHPHPQHAPWASCFPGMRAHLSFFHQRW